MRLLQALSLVPLLTPLAIADDPPYQFVLDKLQGVARGAQGFFEGAVEFGKDFVTPDTLDAFDGGASVVAGQKVERINIRNFQRKLAPKLEGEEEWLVYFTGGNKSCFGRCGPVDLVWNESVPLLAALPGPPSSPKLRLGKVDCERDHVLCTALSASLPSAWHFTIPQKPVAGPNPKVPLHIVPLNISTTRVPTISSIPSASKSRYLEYPEYTGSSHPTDGWLAKYGLLVPLGYALWGIGSMPSWLMMVVVSFVSRQIMSKRLANPTGFAGQPQDRPRAPSGPMPPPAARGGSSQGKVASPGKKRK